MRLIAGEPYFIETVWSRNLCGHAQPCDMSINNGYGCAHPDQEERDGEQGRCYSFSCPVGWEPTNAELAAFPGFEHFANEERPDDPAHDYIIAEPAGKGQQGR